LFLGLGHYKTHLRRLGTALAQRATTLRSALATSLPDFECYLGEGVSSCWLKGPDGLDGRALATAAEKKGVLIEAGDIFFQSDDPPREFLRLGFASIPTERIDTGIAALAEAWREMKA
jgi:GntR family transcriptional regulator/MocR family aminotransferase